MNKTTGGQKKGSWGRVRLEREGGYDGSEENGGTVREKGGTVKIGRSGCDGRDLFHYKSPTVCQGQCRNIRSHPLISGPLPIKSQPPSARSDYSIMHLLNLNFHPVKMCVKI